MRLNGTIARALGVVRRASRATYRGIVLALLAITYVTLVPWFAAAWRLHRGKASGRWRLRDDPDLASIPRLRSLF